MKKYLWIIVLIVAALLYYVFHSVKPAAPTPAPSNTPVGTPIFSWQYTPVNDRDFPKTQITLTATYPDTTRISKDIDTPDGSCNDYANPDANVYPRSTMIICYAAGLGHYYKVVQDNGHYLVQRKTFEEGSPEYTPPELPFETIERF